MSKDKTVLAVEEKFLRALRLVPEGDGWKRADERSWPLVPPSVEDEAGNEPFPSADGDFPADAEGEAESVPAADLLVEALREAVKAYHTREFVLALPLSRLLVKVFSVPADQPDDVADAAVKAIESISPFPDEELSVGVETLAETDTRIRALAGALPEAGASALGEAFEAAGVRIAHVDAGVLGWLRALWPRLLEGPAAARRVVLFDPAGEGWDLAVLDEGTPLLLRGLGALSDPADLVREITLSLLQCERSADVGEVVVVSPAPPASELAEKLAAFGPVRHLAVADEYAGAEGAALRATEDVSLDATPAAWTRALKDARANRRLVAGFAIAAGAWALLMGVLFGGPFVYNQMTDRVKKEIARHQKEYRAVKDMKSRVKLVQKYSDRQRGALEMLKAVSDRLPQEGMVLAKFQYRRGEYVRISGEAVQPTDVYNFKDALAKAQLGDDEPLFAQVDLKGPQGAKNKFDVEGRFQADEDDEAAGTAAKRKGGR